MATFLLDFQNTLFDEQKYEEFLYAEKGGVQDFEEGELSPFLYPDVLPFFKRRANDTCIIVSGGDEELQKEKVEKSGLGAYISDMWMTGSTPKGEVLEERRHELTDEPIIFVDDSAAHLESAQERIPEIVPVRIQRAEDESDMVVMSDFETIQNLDELDAVLDALTEE